MAHSRAGIYAPIILFAFIAVPLAARDITVYVMDTELEMPLEGAVVRAVSGADIVEAVAGADGAAALTVPDKARARVEAAYPGYENAALVLPASGGVFTIGMRLSGGGDLEHEELVVEAARPDAAESKSGRSVAISGENLSRTAEIGILEDVMSSIKLLPGVGYTGMFNAMPSIRGGEPGDLMAVFDGFYIANPYHWGGMVSIFDPRMVQSARLSHGVFSTRYGTTISGLLEVRSRAPESHDVELEMGLSTSAANVSLSYPLFNRGGVMLMGKVTYWDPFVALAKQFVDMVNYIRVAPYIRSAAIGADYRFTANLEGSVSGFVGADGAGAFYDNDIIVGGFPSRADMNFDWFNIQSFLTANLTYNPRPDMALKIIAGGGLFRTKLEGFIDYDLRIPYGVGFWNDFYGKTLVFPNGVPVGGSAYLINTTMYANMIDTTANAQVRADYDWEIGRGFLFAAGVQGLFTKRTLEEHDQAVLETSGAWIVFSDGSRIPAYYNYPALYDASSANRTLSSSAYALVEYASPNKRFGAELGARVDHLYFMGRDFTLQTLPAFNPRLNLDWTIARDWRAFDAVTATLGTGLFSSTTDNISSVQSSDGFKDFELKQNRSWTSIAGIALDFLGYSVNLEGYYKYIFDRAYSALESDSGARSLTIDRHFDGQARVWGIDLMLQKAAGRYWDGWLSYSFNHARYRNPSSGSNSDWFYPSFHRFHNLNLVLNIKPSPRFHIAARLGFASGAPKSIPGAVTSYPVIVLDEMGNPVSIIQKYKRPNYYSDTERDGFALTLDLKFSFFRHNMNGRSRMEFYLAIENVLAMLKTRRTNTSFNAYTGTEVEGSETASYQMPIPMPSIGFKWSY
jgi:hypothetical protein